MNTEWNRSAWDPELEAVAKLIYARLENDLYADTDIVIPWENLPEFTQERFVRTALDVRNLFAGEVVR
jgi:hypothetical protein